MRAFADALDAVPMALAENSGLSPIETLAAIKSRQVRERNSRLGVDCMGTGSNGTSLISSYLFSFPFSFSVNALEPRLPTVSSYSYGISSAVPSAAMYMLPRTGSKKCHPDPSHPVDQPCITEGFRARRWRVICTPRNSIGAAYGRPTGRRAAGAIPVAAHKSKPLTKGPHRLHACGFIGLFRRATQRPPRLRGRVCVCMCRPALAIVCGALAARLTGDTQMCFTGTSYHDFDSPTLHPLFYRRCCFLLRRGLDRALTCWWLQICASTLLSTH